jgi:starch phosphorylase
LHSYLPTYSGDLGILAGDHLKSALDLGLPLVAVSLLYRQGFFQQRLTSDGWQIEDYKDNSFEELPLERCKDSQGQALMVTVQLADRSVKAQVWLARVGRIKLYFLDTNCPDNHPDDRPLTDRLYGGNRETRIAQEFLLGISGVKLLQQLKLEPQVYHLNEGHAAFALLELARQTMEQGNQSFEQVKESVRNRCVFTTHTPVPAGHDTFAPELIDRYFSHYYAQLGLTRESFLQMGNNPLPDATDEFNMTMLALQLCRAANGVSKLNGQVCREMWSVLYPDRPVEQVPIGSITNGIHARTWVADSMADLYAQYLQPNWADSITDAQLWAKIDTIPDQELWQCHQQLKEQLILYTRSQIKQARVRRNESNEFVQAAETLLDPNILTLGFARRFSTYKRGDLLFHDLERARRLFGNDDRPIQIIFAGKAHPADEGSKHIIQRLIDWSHDSVFQNRMVFVENYDMEVAEKLVQGVDVWLNTPRRPQEASGTSGQKVILNSGLHCSVLDGWWDEAYQTDSNHKGINGWTIGDHDPNNNAEMQDKQDAESFYTILEQEIIPCFYDRDESGTPNRWIQKMKASIKTLVPQFNTDRMVMEYVTQLYLSNVTTH